MNSLTPTGLFYTDKPLFGLDIGFNTVKVMQLEPSNQRKREVKGFGVTTFDSQAIIDGVIKDPEIIAKATYELFNRKLTGDITTHRVAMALPSNKTYTRTIRLAKLKPKDLAEAVRLETEQYTPIPIAELYVDYHLISETENEVELLVVAVPSKIVDSYLALARVMDLEPVLVETSISASSRLFVQAENNEVPAVLIDFGSVSSDMTIYDKTLVVTGTSPGGGDYFTDTIAEALKVSKQEAHIIKTKYGMGLSKKQQEITDALQPYLTQLTKEVRRMIRYYQDRSEPDHKIGQIVTMGGGANMPGLSEYMTNQLRMPVRMCDPWQQLDFVKLQPPSNVEKSMYMTVAGLALADPHEAFA
jgi:type IV pilus assembly protein PilM